MDKHDDEGLSIERINQWLGWAVIALASVGIGASILISSG